MYNFNGIETCVDTPEDGRIPLEHESENYYFCLAD